MATGCLVVKTVETAGSIAVSAAKTTGNVAVSVVKAGGSVAAAAVGAGASVAKAGVDTALSLSQSGAVVFLDAQTGGTWSMPWRKGLQLAAAGAGSNYASAKLVRKSGNTVVPQDRWAATYLEDGDVVVMETKSGG